MKDLTGMFPYLAVPGMTLSLLLIFSIAFGITYALRAKTLLHRLRNTYTFPMLLVDLNILIWTLVALWRIHAGDVSVSPFMLQSPSTELLAFLLAFAGLWMLDALVKFFRINLKTFAPTRWTVWFALGSAVFGALEEIVWRAYVLNAIGGAKGLVLSSLGFGLHHLGSSLPHALFAFCGGLILGGVYLKTGGFWGVFFAHGTFNFAILWRQRA